MNKRRKLLDGGMLPQVASFQSLRAFNRFQDDPSASNLYVDFSTDQSKRFKTRERKCWLFVILSK